MFEVLEFCCNDVAMRGACHGWLSMLPSIPDVGLNVATLQSFNDTTRIAI